MAVWWNSDRVVAVVGSELSALASGAYAFGATVVRNRQGEPPGNAGGARFAYLEGLLQFAVAPTSGGVEVYGIPRLDGTNYVDGDASTPPQAALLLGTFTPRSVTTLQRLALPWVQLPPFDFRILVRNNTDRAIATNQNSAIHVYRLAEIWK